MPQVKGLRLPKIKSQPPVTNTVTPLAGGRHRFVRKDRANSKVKELDQRFYTFTPSKPKMSEWDDAILRGYRQNLAQCEKDVCTCACRCHTGDTCDGPIDRVHTPGHRPTYPVIESSPLQPCKLDNMTSRHRHTVTCHDRVDQTLDPRHWRA